MAQVLFLRGNTAQNDAYTGPLGSISIDTQTRRIRIHDGVLAGGHAMAKLSDLDDIVAAIEIDIADIAGLQEALDQLGLDKADKTTLMTAGNGLTGGGSLAANRTFTLGTPTTLTGSSTNSVTADSHTHALSLVKADVGLPNVDNTSDANKPVSTATQTALDLKLNASQKGATDGVAPLVGGKLPNSYLSDSVIGQVEYMGTWDADTNTPTLPTTPVEKGHYYVVTVAGTQFGNDYQVGDWAISNGTVWEIVKNTDAVMSVNGMTGAVTIDKASVGLGNVDNTSDANKPISTATQSALDLKASITYVDDAIAGIDVGGVESVSVDGALSLGGTTANPIVILDLATGSTDGAMSAAQFNKLAGIEAGAEVNTVTSVAGRAGDVTVTKADVGLGSVQNYGMASKAQAVTADSTTLYVSPLRVKEFVEEGEYTIDMGVFTT